MTVTIEKGRASGAVKAPPAKSFIHRQIICAALSGGGSVIHNVSYSEDVYATIDCARALGADIKPDGDTVYVKPGENVSDKLYCRQSGSTLRFFIPVCMSFGRPFTLYGDARLMQRPLDVYEKLCAEQGLTLLRTPEYVYADGRPDLSRVTVSGATSSQFITGLLLAAPLSGRDCTVRITPPFVSRPYVDITRSVMADFGVSAEYTDENTLFVKGGQKYKAAECTAEGDWSGAAFLYALKTLGGAVTVTGLNENSVQGDRVIVKQLDMLSAGHAELDISDCPDNGPVLMACAAALNGATLYGTSRLKLKESDRGAAMAEELLKFGVQTTVYDDKIEIGCGLKKPRKTLYGHDDHRIVMALSVLLTLTGGRIDGAEAVSKSYPGFFDDLRSLNIKIKQE